MKKLNTENVVQSPADGCLWVLVCNYGTGNGIISISKHNMYRLSDQFGIVGRLRSMSRFFLWVRGYDYAKFIKNRHAEGLKI